MAKTVATTVPADIAFAKTVQNHKNIEKDLAVSEIISIFAFVKTVSNHNFEESMEIKRNIHLNRIIARKGNFLSKDVITEFRGRGDEIRITPLSFQEFMTVKEGDRENLLNEYLTYGGLPQVVTMPEMVRKEEYLKNLFTHTYIRDIKERYNIQKDDDLEELVSLVASNIGSLTNPTKLENSFNSIKQSKLSKDTIKTYLDLMQDAFIMEKSVRYDIKGKKYIHHEYL